MRRADEQDASTQHELQPSLLSKDPDKEGDAYSSDFSDSAEGDSDAYMSGLSAKNIFIAEDEYHELTPNNIESLGGLQWRRAMDANNAMDATVSKMPPTATVASIRQFPPLCCVCLWLFSKNCISKQQTCKATDGKDKQQQSLRCILYARYNDT